MKEFLFILLIFYSLLSQNALSDNEASVKKIFEGLNLPAHLSKNEFISPNSIFVLEHKSGQIVEIQNYDKKPQINQNVILNIKSLLSENEVWEQGFEWIYFFSQNLKMITIFLFHIIIKKIRSLYPDLNMMIKLR